MRTLVDIPDAQVETLNRVAKSKGISRAELMRRGIALVLKDERDADIDAVVGIWRDRPGDGLSIERELRSQWER